MPPRFKTRREKSRQIVHRHYHDRGWQSPYKRYEGLLSETLDGTSVVLDVGCGREFPMAGRLSRLAGEVHGVDPVVEPSATVGGVSVRRGNAEQLPYGDAEFDVVTSRCMLEHLKDPTRVFGEFRRVLRPGGRAVFLTPNKYDYISLAAMLIPNALHGPVIKTLEGRSEADTFPTYYRANSMRQIRRIARSTGFVVERLEYLNQYPYLLTFSPLLCGAAIAYDKLICRFAGLHWLQAWLLGSLRKTSRFRQGCIPGSR